MIALDRADRTGAAGRIRWVVLASLVALGLGGCGARSTSDVTASGGGTTFDANGRPTNGGPDLGAAQPETINIDLFSDAVDLKTGGSDPVTITATLIDDQRLPMAATEVRWSASGGVLQDVIGITDENGMASAVLRMPQDFRNRRIEVEVSAGTFSQQIAVNAYGTVLDVQGGERSVVIGNELELAVTLTAGDGEPIINRALNVSTANGNRVLPAEPVTDPNGRATLRIGTELGNDTVTIEALDDPSLTHTLELDVSTDQLSFSTPDGATEFGVNRVESVDVLWSSNGQPVVDGELRITTSAGQLLGGGVLRTDAGGRIRIPLSSGSAGTAQLRVQDALDGDPSGTFELEFVATVPALVDVSTTSSRVFVGGRSDITALVRDAGGNPVKNREVVFTANDLHGGQLNPASAITDADGRARTGFVAGSGATENEAIEIFATVQGASASTGGALASSVRSSVVERRLNVTVGAGSGLESIGLDTQYAQNLVVQVADGSGVPLADASVAVSVAPLSYRKGYLVLVDENGRPEPAPSQEASDWKADRWGMSAASTIDCEAEDANLNRILDVERGEDVNGNGLLDPQDPAVLTAVADAANFATLDGNGTLLTDANGTGYFRLAYPKGNASWSDLRITARVNALGTEGQDSLELSMPVLAADLTDIALSPPNRFSPYGVEPDCRVPR